jgi:dTDP-4-dehydrorhamnose reductase
VQVYDGSRPLWREGDATAPVNAYGRSKLKAEALLAAGRPGRAVALRSSIILGPPPPAPVPRALFLQFIESALRSGAPTSFFEDEFRNPVAVADIVSTIRALLSRWASGGGPPRRGVYNMGGAERLSRVGMAAAVAAHLGLPTAGIVPVPAASVARPVASPADISMDSGALEADLGVRLRGMSEALADVFGPPVAAAKP